MDRAKQGRANKRFGTSVEAQIARLTGGKRVPGSGSIKTSNWSLKGDVHIDDQDGHPLLYIECKGVGTLTPKGEATYTLRKQVLDQMQRESRSQRQLGVVWLHWKHANYETDDYAILTSTDLLELIRLAKIGAAHERRA